MYFLRFIYSDSERYDRYFFFTNADAALKYIKHLVAKEEAYYNCGAPWKIKLYNILPIDTLAQCANAVEVHMWADPDYKFSPQISHCLAEWTL